MRTRCPICLLSLAALAASGCYPESHSGTQDADVRLVEVIEIHQEPVRETLALIGSIESWQEAVLYFEIRGVVAEVFVEEGDAVEPGDSIARLVPDDYSLALSRAVAEAAVATAALELLRAGTREEDIEVARAGYARAQTWGVYWKSELDRNRKLLERGSIPTSVFEQVRRELESAVQDERLTKAQLEKAITGPRREEIDGAFAEAEARLQAAALAKRQLGKATLKAPFRGRVEKRLLDAGAQIDVFPTGGVPVVHLVNLDQVDAVVAVPEAHVQRFADVESVTVASATDPRIRAEAKVISLGRLADRASGTYRLRARMANPDGRFTGGMVIGATVTGRGSRRAIRIPLATLRRAYGRPPYVLLVDPEGGRVVARDVQTGPISGDRVEVLNGLAEDELLIVLGQDSVVAGDQVTYERASDTSGTPTHKSIP